LNIKPSVQYGMIPHVHPEITRNGHKSSLFVSIEKTKPEKNYLCRVFK